MGEAGATRHRLPRDAASVWPSPLYVMRHGQTVWNVERRMQGAEADSPLTDLGMKQAEEMGARLLAAGTSELPVYCSPQARAVETAGIAFGKGRARPDPRLCEIALGPFSGRYLPDLEAQYPELFRDVHPGDWHFRVPGGETFEAMRDRVTGFLSSLRGPCIIVCHGMTSRVLRGVLLGLDRGGMLDLPGGQGVIHVVEDGLHRSI